MCGINVIANFVVGSSSSSRNRRIRAMNAALHHRGPDEAGVFTSDNGSVVLGSTRLSIVDVPGGKMPIRVRGFAIVFNGEIFNFRELRAALPANKYSFCSASDTEVLLCAYLEWGPQCVERFSGQFAFAIYDARQDSIFFARDRVGIKPLFYTVLGDGTLLISSEPKGILSVPEFERVVDKHSVAAYVLGSLTLTNGTMPLDRSWFRGLRSLKPGMTATFDATGSVRIERYAELPFGTRAREGVDTGELVRAMRSSLEKAILDRLPEEVRCGAALSGGVDSSIVSAIAAGQFSAAKPLTACTIRFDDAQNNNEDFRHAVMLAERDDIELLAPVLASEEMMANLDALTIAMDQPHDTVRQLGLYLTFRSLKRAGCKVVLVGEGSDEFNLGYWRASPGFAKDIDTCQTAEAFRELMRGRAVEAQRYFNAGFLDTRDFDAVIECDVAEYYLACPSTDPTERMEYYYAKKFLKYRLDANDRCAMAHSVEARVPFCDTEANLSGGGEKAVLRAAFKDVLPPQIARRAKFALPESRDVRLYRMILEQFDVAFAAAEPAVWDVLDRTHLARLRAIGEAEVGAVERGEVTRHTLTDEQALTEPVSFRIKHIFMLLTFLRWHALYFGGGSRHGAITSARAAAPSTSASRKKLQLLLLLVCVFLFSGVVFGFAPLLLLLEREGMYSELCGDAPTPCDAQKSRLNLGFVLATVGLNLASFPFGVFLDRYGQRVALATSAALAVSGMVGLAFADSEHLDIFVPSLMAVAFGGILNLLAAYSSSFLVQESQPVIIATFSCTFDLSTVVFAIFNNLNMSFGINRRQLFLSYAGLVAAAAAPPIYLWGNGLEGALRASSTATKCIDTSSPDITRTAEDGAGTALDALERRGFRVQVRTLEFAFVASYATIEMFRANTYIGSVVELLNSYGDDDHLYSEIFSYVLPAGILFVPMIGYSVTRFGLNGSLLLSSLLGGAFSALSLVPDLHAQVVTFVVFVIFRAMLYSVMNTFCAARFGLNTVGRIIGAVFTVAALFGLVQYPILDLTRTHLHGDFTVLFVSLCGLTLPLALMTLAMRREGGKAGPVQNQDALSYSNADCDKRGLLGSTEPLLEAVRE